MIAIAGEAGGSIRTGERRTRARGQREPSLGVSPSSHAMLRHQISQVFPCPSVIYWANLDITGSPSSGLLLGHPPRPRPPIRPFFSTSPSRLNPPRAIWDPDRARAPTSSFAFLVPFFVKLVSANPDFFSLGLSQLDGSPLHQKVRDETWWGLSEQLGHPLLADLQAYSRLWFGLCAAVATASCLLSLHRAAYQLDRDDSLRWSSRVSRRNKSTK